MSDMLHYEGCGCTRPALRITDQELAAHITRWMVCPIHGRTPRKPRVRKQYHPTGRQRRPELIDIYWGPE